MRGKNVIREALRGPPRTTKVAPGQNPYATQGAKERLEALGQQAAADAVAMYLSEVGVQEEEGLDPLEICIALEEAEDAV